MGPVLGGVLRVKVSAPPIEGKANEALVAILARSLGVPKRAVEIIGGAASRDKTIRVVGVTLPQLENLFAQSSR